MLSNIDANNWDNTNITGIIQILNKCGLYFTFYLVTSYNIKIKEFHIIVEFKQILILVLNNQIQRNNSIQLNKNIKIL